MEKQCVVCEKEIVFLNIIHMDFMFRSVQYALSSLFRRNNSRNSGLCTLHICP